MLRRVLGVTVLALLLPLAQVGAQKASAENPAVVEVAAVDDASCVAELHTGGSGTAAR